MPTYVYETLPAKKNGKAKRYEFRQSIKDEPLKRHPETGEPLKRAIAGGFGLLTSQSGSSSHAHAHTSSCCGGGGCGR